MDKRAGQERQSSLPSSLHQHIVTRPHPRIPQPRSSSSSEIAQAEREGGPFTDSPYQLRPIVPSLSPATFGDDRRRTSGVYQHRGTHPPDPGDAFHEDGGNTPRVTRPYPRWATNRPVAPSSSIPHGYLPPISSVFNEPFPSYAYTLSAYTGVSPARTPPPPWQEGEAGPSSLSRSRPDQSHQSERSAKRSRTQPEIPTRERIESLPGFHTFEWETGQPDPTNRADAAARRTWVSDRPEVGSGEYPGRGGTVSAQLTPDSSHLHSRQYQDAQRRHSLPSEFVPGQHPNLFPSNRAQDEAAPYPGSILSGYRDDLPPPYPQGIASPSTPEKKEFQDDKIEQSRDFGEIDDDEVHPRKKARRKAVVACTFCQRRKLRCSTEKPKCSNCGQRGIPCIYGPPKRRGPGKAPRGSRSKKTPAPVPGEGVPAPPPPVYSPPFPGHDFSPNIPAYTYPYPPHPRSTFMRAVETLAPLDTVSSRSAATAPPQTGSTVDALSRGASRNERPGKRRHSETQEDSNDDSEARHWS